MGQDDLEVMEQAERKGSDQTGMTAASPSHQQTVAQAQPASGRNSYAAQNLPRVSQTIQGVVNKRLTDALARNAADPNFNLREADQEYKNKRKSVVRGEDDDGLTDGRQAETATFAWFQPQHAAQKPDGRRRGEIFRRNG